MRKRTERPAVSALFGAIWFAAMPTAAVAQGGPSLFERLNLDRLELSALGASYGPVRVPRVEPTDGYSLHADYGEITHNWRVVFALSYWGSRFTDEAVRELVSRLQGSIRDPSGDDTLDVGSVRLSDIAVEADMRWTPLRNTLVRPYAGGGMGAHVINAESRLFNDTFVERAFDNITVGFAGVVGVDVVPRRYLAIGVQGRYHLLSNLRFATARVSATYYFGTQTSSQ